MHARLAGQQAIQPAGPPSTRAEALAHRRFGPTEEEIAIVEWRDRRPG